LQHILTPHPALLSVLLLLAALVPPPAWLLLKAVIWVSGGFLQECCVLHDRGAEAEGLC
jgi:hypothetical protein